MNNQTVFGPSKPSDPDGDREVLDKFFGRRGILRDYKFILLKEVKNILFQVLKMGHQKNQYLLRNNKNQTQMR